MFLSRANSHIAIQLHRMFAKDKQNVFFSPFSISTCMAMLFCAAEKETALELKSALGYDQAEAKTDDIASMFQQQMSVFLKNDDSYTLSCANSMLSQKGFEIKDAYKKILEESFKALVLEADFVRETQTVTNQINNWVNEKTNGMIPKMIETIDPSTVMVLINAVYFKGTWKHQFEKEATRLQKFYNKGSEDNGKLIDMMNLKKSFPFYEDETLKVLQLPYVGEEIAMMILLPQAKDGLESVEKGLTPTFVEDLKKKLRKQKIEVTLPRFRLEYKKSLVSYFQQLGVQRAFSQGAEFGIASDSSDLAVSEILHKAVLEVNEEGSEAAAVTMGMVMMCAFMPEPEFVADHPFAFVIYDTRSDLILFMGRVEEL